MTDLEGGTTECQVFFEQLDQQCDASGTNKIRGPKLREMGKERIQRLLDWENQVASRFSPGPVGSTETIRKALYHKHDVVDGSIYRGVFSSLDELGLSADRLEKTTPEEVQGRFKEMASLKQRDLYGYVDIDVAFLRHMQATKGGETTSVRAIGVYDTAQKENAAHAEAFLIVKFSNKKPIRTIEQDLFDRYRTQIKAY